MAAGTGADPARAATLEACEATQPTGPVVELDGDLTLNPVRATRKAWKRSGVRQRLVKPASGFTGRPTFPVKSVRYGEPAAVTLKGGTRLLGKGRKLAVSKLKVLSAPGKPAWLKAKIGGRTISFLKITGGKRKYNAGKGTLTRTGTARLVRPAANLINRKLGLKGGRKLRAGTVWGSFNLYSLYKVTPVNDPTGEVPDIPPVKTRPGDAVTISSAATIKWYVRESFINYVASGEGTRVENGATADPASGSYNLVYSFNFPFASGWTVPESGGGTENTLIKGSGLVGFRYCQNTINFTAANPEVEIDGDDNSRLIFEVNGTDGTPFPDQRAVMVKLIPSRAQSDSVVDNGNGTSTRKYVKIPGYVPAEGTGIFAGFYPAFSPDFDGQPQDERPDRFGYFTISYTFPN
ncbi:MAG: HtaA domain-containing protein [Solirubrobacterales bacterium]|nr:HtaA domain-containing protein [Solirubrobacterales bacterium]MCB8915889.1 HtaA domain-containing protein [Thermoleophilales bacterium]